ncbi:preprotein translocase subunit SecA [Anaerolineales bacterium]
MERAISKYRDTIDRINALESELQKLSDQALSAKTVEFKQRLEKGETIDDLLIEAFAVVRETAQRTIKLRPYDVQLIGGIVLHEGRIAEMKTGEGKTLVAALPIYLNALEGKGVHLVTPNDYLSKHGLQTMGPIYSFLGLTSAVIQNTGGQPDSGSFLFDPNFQSEDARFQFLKPISRRDAYLADITYGTNNEYGFDYLRDNMVWANERRAQRDLNFAIIDEVDNILIDEARTPLIISGPADEPSEYYGKFASLVRRLKPSSEASVEAEDPDGDYIVDEKDRIVYLTENGVERVEQLIGVDQLYHPDHAEMLPYLDNCLRAQVLYQNDKEYVVQDGQVVIVDDFTGRLMPGRRFSEGLHQAIEAKENLQVRRENMTLATVTFQNFFRMYDKLSGMTGTALTEAEEFEKIYEIDVVAIPTNRDIIRDDMEDLVFLNEKAKWDAVVKQIQFCQQKNQPVLVGTVAIETSERLSNLLKRNGIQHTVLNAKQHEREATIIAQAGRPGNITIATNMAGRGVDILLGGNPEGLAREKLRQRYDVDITEATPEQWAEVLAEAQTQCRADREVVLQAGGLYVLGTERHEARRIDNQLRGRSGRQGDPGASRFFLSLEDDLVRRFGGDRVKSVAGWANLPEDEPLTHRWISKTIEQAQVRVEGYHFDIRKRVLDYDDVVNRQRETMYGLRHEWLEADADELKRRYLELVKEQIAYTVQDMIAGAAAAELDDTDYEALYRQLLTIFPVPEDVTPDTFKGLSESQINELLLEKTEAALDMKTEQLEAVQENLMSRAMRELYLRSLDMHWQQHLTDLDILREGIGLMSIAQRDPLVEYQREAFNMFNMLQDQIDLQALRYIFSVQPTIAQRSPVRRQMQMTHSSTAATADPQSKTVVRSKEKLGRNDPCWCGSGEKYKNCHYKEDKKRA